MELKSLLRDKREYILLLAVFLIAIALRLITAKYDRLLGADPWRHLKIAELLLETGEFPLFYSYTFYPRVSLIGSYSGLYYLPVYIYKILEVFEVSFFKVFQLLPAIFGALSVAPLYMLVKELFDKRVGLLSALLIAISPANLERSLAGYYRGDVFMVFFMLLAFYFFVISVKRNIVFSLLSGIFLFVCNLFWDGWPFAFVVISLAFVLGIIFNYFKSLSSKNLIIVYIVSFTLGLSLIYIYKQHFYQYTIWHLLKPQVISVGKLFLLSLLVVLLEPLNRLTLRKKAQIKMVLFFLVLVLTSALAYYFGLLHNVLRFADTLIHWSTGVESASTYSKNITEMQKITLSYLFRVYYFPILLLPLGLFSIIRKLDFGSVFTIGLFFTSVLTFIWIVRFTFLASPAVLILLAIGIASLPSRRKIVPFFLSLLFASTAVYSLGFTSEVEPLIYPELYQALNWIRENTPDDAVIGTWWHYTGAVNAIADRRVPELTTPTTITRGFATLLCTDDEDEAIEIAISRGLDYIIVDRGLYLLWNVILNYCDAGNHILRDSMLSKFYKEERLHNFRLEYSNNKVRVYAPVYHYAKFRVISDKFIYKAGQKIILTLNGRSNIREVGDIKSEINIIDSEDNSVFRKILNLNLNESTTMDISMNLPKGRYRVNVNVYVDKRYLGWAYTTFVVM
jgi:dolichyl-diphosphooligosaccharide--protein glycosyltransferase